METRKQAILAALDKFVRQRPGLDFCNYGDGPAYRAEQRSITRDLHDYRELERAVLLRDGITADDVLAAQRAFSGRLSIILSKRTDPESYEIDYCTGQYFPTEYRKAACAVLATAIWDYWCEHCMPEPTYAQHGSATDHPMRTEALHKGMRAGDWLCKDLRREFGRGIQSRWFN